MEIGGCGTTSEDHARRNFESSGGGLVGEEDSVSGSDR